jgi:uncharacterized protein YyaL (SSP411 family)
MRRIRAFTIDHNNLDKSSSPYLLQHTGNPIWWQEWSDDLIRYAVKINKPLLVSVGYATCHWCHVMAAEAFSDKNTAEFLNEHFICIKIDREQRPDIDQFMMDFINRQNGHGGWPLNVFLTPSLHPVFALTYAPLFSRDSMYSFLSVAEKVYEYFEKNIDKIPPFASVENRSSVADERSLVEKLSEYYDAENGGFGRGQKFPSHSTMLYLLYQLSIDDSPSIKTICIKTLDAMLLKGLNDHLQGGIFRYCVDNEWTIPHFEKMLYDQAMALWVYSLAYRVIGNVEYQKMAEKILRCLEESFKADGLYISAHDADTEHVEGATYLWSYEQLKDKLLPEEFFRFSETFYISKSGNFEGLNHLIIKNNTALNGIEDKLLSIRKSRKQPSRDDKILSGINALVAVGMIQAGRLLNKSSLEENAAIVVHNIIGRFWDGKTLGHSYYDGILQKQGFLFDAAALLTAISMLYERDSSWSSLMTEMAIYVESYKEGEAWIESRAEDFQTVYASWFDHPIPSSVSLAVMGLGRVAYLTGKEIKSVEYRQPFQSDFYNIAVMMYNGLFHIYTSIEFITWNLLPVNSVQVRGAHEQDCYMGTCSPLGKQLLP